MAQKYMRLKDVAEYLHVSVMTIHRWRKSLNFPVPLNMGTKEKKALPIWPKEEVDAWINRNRT